MQITHAIYEVLSQVFGVATATIIAVAGLWRFRAWWQDRQELSRIGSAEFFAKTESGTWSKAFGDRELSRIHFRRLTGVDRRSGHDAVVGLHKTLGLTDSDWEALGKANRFVRVRGSVGTVRRLSPADFRIAGFAVIGGVSLFLIGVLLTTFSINLGVAQIGKDISLETLTILLIAILYAALFFVGGLACYQYVESTITALGLRKRLLTLRHSRKAKSRKQTSLP